MKKLVVLLLASLVATSAFAVIDPDDNMMGIYFDRAAEDNCLTVGASMPFDVFLVLTHPTGPAYDAYELGIRNVGATGLIFKLTDIPGAGQVSGINVADPVPTAEGGDYVVGLAAPLFNAEAIVLHQWSYMLLAQVSVEMFIGAASTSSIPGSPFPVVEILFPDQTIELVNVGTSTGGVEIPVATVNLDCVVAVENASFGSVKSLFR